MKLSTLITTLLALFFVAVPSLVFATIVPDQTTGGFVPLTSIPAFQGISTSSGIASFLNNLYKIAIGVAAVLAILQITRAGIEYMGGDSITEKKHAKDLLWKSLLGLLLVLSPAIVYGIIDPRILNLNVDVGTLTPTARTQTETTAETQACPANITDGAVFNSDFAHCCEPAGFRAESTRGGNVRCTSAPSQAPSMTAGEHGASPTGGYFYNIPTTRDQYGELRFRPGATERDCTQIAYSAYPDQAQCQTAVAAHPARDGWESYGSCFRELGTTRHLNGEAPFCENVQVAIPQ